VSRKAFGIQLVCAVAVAMGGVEPAFAQRLKGGPFTGLFNGSGQDQPHTLELKGSAFTGWDDNPLAQTTGNAGNGLGATAAGISQPGMTGGFDAGVNYGYSRSGTRSHVSVSAAGTIREFRNPSDDGILWSPDLNAGVSMTTNISPKVSFGLGAGVAYAPYYRYAPFLKDIASEESPVGSDYGFAVESNQVTSLSSSLSLVDRFSKKSSVSANVGWTLTQMPISTPLGLSSNRRQSTIDTRTVGARFSHSLTRKFAVNLGYSIQQTRYLDTSDTEPVLTHGLDIGLGYGDGITVTFARHYTLSMSVGASVAKNGDPESVLSTGKSTAVNVTGGATLSRSLGQTWSTSIGYTRGTSYVVGFKEPIMSDTGNAGIGGQIAERLHFSMGAGASRGQPLFTASSEDLISYTGSSRLTFGLFTNIGLYAQASYSYFSIPPSSQPERFVPKLDRRSVSAGVTTWLPLIKPKRTRGDAAEAGKP
jgi:hypothetical protein